MKSRRYQSGWYTGWMPVMLVVVLTLFVAQPWVPLMLLATGAAVLLVQGVIWLMHYVSEQWHHSHTPRVDH